MIFARIVDHVKEAQSKGYLVEIMTPLHGDFEPLGTFKMADEGWVSFTIKGLGDVRHYVAVDKILGLRFRPDDE